MIEDWCSKTVRVRVPATSANVGAGFDCLGFAVTLYSELELTLTSKSGLDFQLEGEGSDEIVPEDENIVWNSIRKMLERIETPQKILGAKMKMKNSIPLSRGLGSSAAAIVSGLFAANECLDNPLNREQILDLATEIEGHPDNVAPALNGNFTVNVMKKFEDRIQVDSFNFKPQVDLKFIAAIPNFHLETKKARAVLPTSISRADAIFNLSRVAMLIASLSTGDERFLSEAFDDRLHQPYRMNLIPGMSEVFKAAKESGAIGACLSGAGPCLIAFTLPKLKNEIEISNSMRDAFSKFGIESRVEILDLDSSGAVVI